MKSKKKIILVIILILLAIGLSVGAVFAWNNYKKQKKLKEEQQKAEITEVFHDQGGDYMLPSAPGKEDEVTVRLRCSKYNLTKAQIQITLDKGTTWTCIDMTQDGKDDTGYYQFWKGTIPAQTEPYFYRFAVGNEEQSTLYYGSEGLKSYQLDTNEMFYVIPGFNTPEWSQGTLWYYAHIGQFCNGDTSNDIYREYLLRDVSYGNDGQSMTRGSGDIEGLKSKLDYIQSLGVKSLAVGPYFSSSEQFGFGIDNMASVETAFGNETELKSLIHDVHDRGMKITTDMILSYTVNYSKYFNEYAYFPTSGAYQSKDSQYFDMFRFPQWPYNAVKIWNSMGLNVANDQAAGKIYKDNDSMVLRYLNEPYGLDGYRFDAEESVGNLGFDYDPQEIFGNITSSIKGVSKDKLILSENPDGIGDQYNTLFDSSWQKKGYFAMKDWFQGGKSGSEMLTVLQDNLINTARPRALSSYNFLGQHDVVRMFDDTKSQKNAIQSLLLLQMTYLGSPVIYFGDEVGMTNGAYDDQVGQTFNWDESHWDYKVLNLIKSLGALRDKYSCLKNGVICQGEINDPEMFFAFGRFDDDGAVITLCNKQLVNLQEEINVSRYNISDGDVLTDYLTGKTYKVKNGKVTVDVIPGGTVLVTGDDVSEYREDYTITDMGEDIEVLQSEQSVFDITGKGTLEGKEDSFGMLAKPVYNNISLAASLNQDAKAAIMLRDDTQQDSAFYSAVYDNGTVTIKARTVKGAEVKELAKTEVSKDSQIKIVRTDGNKFAAMYRDGGQGGWINIENSNADIIMDEQIYAGMTALDDTAIFSNILFEEQQQQLCDDFETEQLGSMFTASDQDIVPKDGTLKLTAKDNKLANIKANAHTSDWTFKTEVGAVVGNGENALAGVMSEGSENDRVVLGRTVENGENVIALAKLVQDKWQIYATVKDTKPQDKVTLQLQRIGSTYTAVASYDGQKWFAVGDSIYCNYTSMYAGLCVYNAEAGFEYACFGDSIHDQESTNTPITLRNIVTSYNAELRNIEGDKMTFLGSEDNWSDIGPGYAKSTSDDTSMMYLENKVFDDVKAEATIKITDGDGTAGILIGKQKYSKNIEQCYQIGFDKNNKLFISKDGKELASTTIEPGEDGLRLIVRKDNEYINVMAGQTGTPILSVKDDTYGEGYVAFYADKTAVEIINYDVTAVQTYWNSNRTAMGAKNNFEVMENNSLVSLEGVGITSGVVSFQAKTTIPVYDWETESDIAKKKNQIGVILGGSFGQMSAYGGVTVLYDYKAGTLTATEGEKELAKKNITEPGEAPEITMKIVMEKGKYDIYVNDSKEPVMTVNREVPNGGAVSLYSSEYTTVFSDIVVKDITNGGNANVKSTSDAGTAFSTDFSDWMGWNKNFYKIKADGANWCVEDGVLKGKSLGRTWNIANVMNGEYENVDISMKFRYSQLGTDSTGTFRIGVGKKDLYAGCDETGVCFNIFGTGLVQVIDTDTEETVNGWDTYIAKLNDWHDIHIRVANKQVRLSIDGKEVYSGTVSSETKGYIAIQSDLSDVEVDDFAVTPLS